MSRAAYNEEGVMEVEGQGEELFSMRREDFL